MPVHDWSRLDQGVFHSFHVGWVGSLSAALTTRILPDEYYSLALPPVEEPSEEAIARIAAEYRELNRDGSDASNMTCDDDVEAEARQTEYYARRRRSIGIFATPDERLVGLIEILSPGNKSTAYGMEKQLNRLTQAFEDNLSVLLVDIHQPSMHDPNGIHGAIMAHYGRSIRSPNRCLTAASYQSGLHREVCIKHFGIGDALPDMPLFLGKGVLVNVCLEVTYQAAFPGTPRHFQERLIFN